MSPVDWGRQDGGSVIQDTDRGTERKEPLASAQVPMVGFEKRKAGSG